MNETLVISETFKMNETLARSAKIFRKHFDSDAEYYFYAPGRINLIGEHTDYNNGFVLPCAIDRGTYISISANSSNLFRVVACDIDEQVSEWSINAPVLADNVHSWANYLRGVQNEFLKRGYQLISGYDLSIAGNIPQGAGLSSSASVSVAFATAIAQLNQISLSPAEIALICQTAENNFVGCHCGIMDQLISASGKKGKALLIDCQDLSTREISMPSDLALMIIDSKVKRGLVESEYNLRRQQCEEAAKIMGVTSLRDADLNLLAAHKMKMSDVVFRRARHVLTENSRTLAAAEALNLSDVKTLSRLMAESHVSMRDDFEITVKPIDLLVEWVSNLIGEQGGVRMTGGGFGGCLVALLPANLCEPVKQLINSRYFSETGLHAEVYVSYAGDGAGIVINS